MVAAVLSSVRIVCGMYSQFMYLDPPLFWVDTFHFGTWTLGGEVCALTERLALVASRR